MTVFPVEKPVASAAYSFVRFIGGGLAPYAAGRLVVATNIHVPFLIAAGNALSPARSGNVILAAVDTSPMERLIRGSHDDRGPVGHDLR
jgi:hypothetical protein